MHKTELNCLTQLRNTCHVLLYISNHQLLKKQLRNSNDLWWNYLICYNFVGFNRSLHLLPLQRVVVTIIYYVFDEQFISHELEVMFAISFLLSVMFYVLIVSLYKRPCLCILVVIQFKFQHIIFLHSLFIYKSCLFHFLFYQISTDHSILHKVLVQYFIIADKVFKFLIFVISFCFISHVSKTKCMDRPLQQTLFNMYRVHFL